MKFLHPERDATLELALEDGFLTQGYFSGPSRLGAELRPADLPRLPRPLVRSYIDAAPATFHFPGTGPAASGVTRVQMMTAVCVGSPEATPCPNAAFPA